MVGEVKAGGGLQTQLVSGRAGEIAAQGGIQLGDAVDRLVQTGLGYLNSRTDIERIYDERAMKSESLELDTKFLQYQEERGKEFAEFSRGRSSTPGGMTKDYDAVVAQKEKEFLATVPARHREEMTARLAQDRARRVGSAFTSELELLDTADTNALNTSLNTLGSGLKAGTVSLEDAEATFAESVMKSALPAEQKQQFIERGKATLQGLEFGTVVEQTAKGYGTVGEATGQDVVAAGLLPQERGVLNAIASNESPGYNIWNGGSSFQGYEDHPAASSKAPGKSTAAGRYQFLLGTWRAASASYEKTYGVKVPDFSPEWQDRVALHWAEKRFNDFRTGKSFRQILADGKPEELLILRDVLGKPRSANPNDLEWAGVGAMSDSQFIAVMTGQQGYAGGGTGTAAGPNVWSDPRFASLSLDEKQGFANSAAAAAENSKQSMATQLKLERDQFLDQAYNAGYANNTALLEEMKQSRLWDADAAAKASSGSEVFRKSENDVSTVGAALAAGTPLSTAQQAAFGKWFGAESFAGVAAGDEASMNKMRWAVEQARMFPDGSVDAFRTALAAPETQGAALGMLASALAGDPSILRRSGFSQEDVSQVQLYQNIAKRAGNADQALTDYRKATDMAAVTGKTAAQLETESIKLFSTAYPTADDLVDKFDGWFSFSPNTTLNENTGNQLMLDASTAYQDGFKIYGTEEGAEAYMQTALDNLWGVSVTKTFRNGNAQMSQNVLMKFPPEKYYVSQDGDFGYLYKSMSDYAVANGAQASDAVLMADAQTDKEVRAGKKPTYKVIGKDEFGGAMVLPGRFGGDDLDAGVIQSVTEESNRRNSIDAVGANTRQLLDIDGKIKTAEATGDTKSAAILREARVKSEQQLEAAKLAAVEQGFLIPNLPADVNDPRIAQSVELMRKSLAEDPTMERRVEFLSRKYKDVPRDEARMRAVAEVIEKEMRITPEMAMAAAQKMLEQAK